MKHLIILFIIASIHPVVCAQIRIDQEVLYKNQQVTITTDKPVDTMTITYRPNSQVTSTEYLTSSVPATSFQWTPAEAGVVAIAAGDAATTVSVRFQGISWSGIAVMVVAAVLLFGGATYAFRLLMYGKAPEEIGVDIEHRVDT